MTLIEKIENHQNALTVGELGLMLNISVKTLYAAIKAGKLPVMRVLGSIRIDPIVAAQWLRDRSTRKK